MRHIFANIWPAKDGRLEIGSCFNRYWKGGGCSGANVVFLFADKSDELIGSEFLGNKEAVSSVFRLIEENDKLRKQVQRLQQRERRKDDLS